MGSNLAFITAFKLVVGSNLAAMIEFSRFSSTFGVGFFSEKFNKSENNIICIELEKGTTNAIENWEPVVAVVGEHGERDGN